MDDCDKQNKNIKGQTKPISVIQRYISNVSDVLSPLWVRRTIQIDNGNNWFVLDSRFRFLFNFRLFLVIIYLSYEILK